MNIPAIEAEKIPTWKDVFNPNTGMVRLSLEETLNLFDRVGYRYFLWNGRVYTLVRRDNSSVMTEVVCKYAGISENDVDIATMDKKEDTCSNNRVFINNNNKVERMKNKRNRTIAWILVQFLVIYLGIALAAFGKIYFLTWQYWAITAPTITLAIVIYFLGEKE